MTQGRKEGIQSKTKKRKSENDREGFCSSFVVFFYAVSSENSDCVFPGRSDPDLC